MPPNAEWGQPLSAPAVQSIDNIYEIAPEVYRSGQPTAEDMQALDDFGVRTVLNLRWDHSDESIASGTNLILKSVPMRASDIKDDDIVAALKIIKSSPKPILIHCWHGSDRTGVVVAIYRLVFDGWTKEQAIEELMWDSYGHHSLWYPNIERYINEVDVDKIRDRL